MNLIEQKIVKRSLDQYRHTGSQVVSFASYLRCVFLSVLEFCAELETQVCVLHSNKSDGNPGQHESKSRPEGASFDMNLCCLCVSL